MEKLIIFGTGDIAQIADYYFKTDSSYEVVAFTVNQEFIKETTFCGKPVISWETIQDKYPPGEVKLFIATSYAKMNKVREAKYFEAKKIGYELVSYISSKCTYLAQEQPGDNCFIFEDNTIQPFVKIGSNVTLWSGNHIGHHSVIEDHNFISSHVVVSGHCHIEPNCFVGVNSSLAHKVRLGRETLVGAGAVISKNTEAGSVYVPPRSVLLEKKSFDISL